MLISVVGFAIAVLAFILSRLYVSSMNHFREIRYKLIEIDKKNISEHILSNITNKFIAKYELDIELNKINESIIILNNELSLIKQKIEILDNFAIQSQSSRAAKRDEAAPALASKKKVRKGWKHSPEVLAKMAHARKVRWEKYHLEKKQKEEAKKKKSLE